MSNLKVAKLSPQRVGENVVARLEEMLATAKRGGVTNCAITMLHDDGDVTHAWANKCNPFTMIGAAFCTVETLREEITSERQ